MPIWLEQYTQGRLEGDEIRKRGRGQIKQTIVEI